MRRPTLKQEQFCQVFIEIENASKAYREVYGTPETKASTCYQNAYLLKQNPLVAERIKQLHKAKMRQIKRQYSNMY